MKKIVKVKRVIDGDTFQTRERSQLVIPKGGYKNGGKFSL